MGKFKGLTIFLVCIALAFAMFGCSTPGGRSAGEVVDDSTIVTKVKAKLIRDSILQGFAIDVDVFQGEVTLTGGVNTPDQKERAGQISRDTMGVRKVNNLLKVK
ncbi:MAG: BON domain-containing protein [Desulfobacteraceae bacterium]|jgi:hyperosmotically inducible protein